VREGRVSTLGEGRVLAGVDGRCVHVLEFGEARIHVELLHLDDLGDLSLVDLVGVDLHDDLEEVEGGVVPRVHEVVDVVDSLAA